VGTWGKIEDKPGLEEEAERDLKEEEEHGIWIKIRQARPQEGGGAGFNVYN